jgi:hypothetical protein
MGKWKTKSTFPTFPPPRILSLTEEEHKTRAGYRPPPEAALRARLNHDIYELGNILA